MSSLCPDLLDTFGLVAILKHYLGNFTKETEIEVIAKLPEHLQIDLTLGICLFRVTQEALTNAYRHFRADTMQVILWKSNRHVSLRISDNGKGFDMSRNISGK
jgi:signal transduction histidine kinase